MIRVTEEASTVSHYYKHGVTKNFELYWQPNPIVWTQAILGSKGKQQMLRIIGEEALPKNCVHRDHGRKRDPKQHLPCGSSSIQWVTLNERDAFHRSPVDVNLVYWDQKLTFLNWNVSLQESLNILTLFQFERKTNIQISESSCARAMSLPHVLCRCIYYFVHCIWFLFFFPVESF